MRLSKLHISGFKSFPDRSELGFDEGVTAIVGPNGCGKSNVVDAITWVLGEQSAKSLRGERMEDVIFNGSDARKPTSTAEVRLRLANVTQGAAQAPTADELLDAAPLVTRDVEIGRRLYRSGESEYLIDGEVCRLRDVHDLLMDSGLGVKAYAVIEQGKIGQILSSRPAERRTLIEEAAGVTKYKSRRRAAELKLEAARQNLTRIDDIVFEVEKQRGALKRQAARARRYKRLREELRRWEQVQFARRHEVLSQQIAAVEARLAGALEREAAASAHVAGFETALEAVRIGLTEAEAAATTTREDAHANELAIGRHQQQIAFDRQQIEELAKRAESLRAEARELEGRREPMRAGVAAQREAAARTRGALEQASGRVRACEADYAEALQAVQDAEQDADVARAALLAANTTLSALRQARDNAAAARDRVAVERGRLEVEAQDLQREVDRAERDREQSVRALGLAREALDAAIRQRGEAEATLAGRRVRRDDLADTLATGRRTMAGHEARLRSLEELEARRARFGDAARFLLAETGATLQSHGAVADHIGVEPSYERAVNALLGDLLEHVLVNRYADVEQAVERLAAANQGRCGFLVLEETAGRDVQATGAAPEGARRLSDVVRATGPYAAAISLVLGDALIVGSLEAARALAATVRVPVATTNGEVLRGSWLIEAGLRQDTHGILETRADLGRLRVEIEAKGAEIHRLGNDVLALDFEVSNDEIEVARLVKEQHAQEMAIVGLDSQVAHAGDEVARLGRRSDVVATERRRAEEEEAAAEGRREEAAAAIVTQEGQQQQAEAALADVVAKLQAAREQSGARMRLVTESRTEEATLAERVAALDVEVARLEEAARDLEDRIAARQGDVDAAEARRGELQTAVSDNVRRLDLDAAALERLKAELRDLDDRTAELRAEFGEKEHEIRTARASLEAVRAEVTHAEVARATAESDLAHLSSTCMETLEMSLGDVVLSVARMQEAGELLSPGSRLAAIAVSEDEDEGGDGAEAKAADEPAAPSTADDVIASLRLKIERLGPVNMMAIEQFDELEARHTFLTTQRQDLLDSIAQTGEAIRRIDKTTRERFEEAFVTINTNFEQTFTTLFGGGRAGLVLIDLDNEQESGIDIIAQPPGKRLQNVQLLSGGEKALTAMALMFAIFKYRPSPFCLLDEIDAPLDDANIGRFIEMLQGMQTHTQFILITHNRKTMEIANRLYGVTMEEPGVSKLISLQLN